MSPEGDQHSEPGTEQWSFETGNWVRCSPTVADGTVYVGSDDAHLYAMETTSGHEESPSSKPALGGEANGAPSDRQPAVDAPTDQVTDADTVTNPPRRSGLSQEALIGSVGTVYRDDRTLSCGQSGNDLQPTP